MTNVNSNAWRLYERTVVQVVATMFAVGAVGHSFAQTLPVVQSLTPFFLFFVGCLALVPSVATGGRWFAWWAVGTYVFVELVEMAGVATGAIFGSYAYGSAMGWTWRGVPLIIGFNWIMIINGAMCLASQILPDKAYPGRRLAQVLFTGLFAVLFDVFLEPVAIRLDYWRWEGNVVPLQNYVAWFVVALLAAMAHPQVYRSARGFKWPSRLAMAYVLIQMVFFVALQVVWRIQGI